MERTTVIGNNIEGILRNMQKNQNIIGRSTDIMKFIDERGFRPNLRIVQNIYEEFGSFHKKTLNLMQFGFKLIMELLSRTLDVLKEVISRLRSWNHGGGNHLKKGVNISKGISVATVNTKNNAYSRTNSKTNKISFVYTISIQEKNKDGMGKKVGDKFLDKLIDNTIGKIIEKYLQETLGKVFEKIADRVFPKALGKKFDKLADKISSSKSGKSNSPKVGASIRIPKVSNVSKGSMGNSKKTGASSMINSVKNMSSTMFTSLSKSGSNMLKMLGALSKSISKINIGHKLMRFATLGAAAAQWVLNSALLANPMTWIIVGIVALIGMIVLLVKHWDTVKAAIGKFWNFVVSIFSNIGSWFKRNVIEPILNLMPSWLKKLLGVGGNKVDVNVNTKGKVDGTYANGLSYVPYDGFVAELHKGERVLTASENKKYGSTSGDTGNTVQKGGNTFNITINGVNKSTNEIINEIVAKIKETAGTMGEVAYSI